MQLEQSFMPLMIAFGWLSAMLLVGVLLRAKVPLFQKFLFPACLLGGLLGFVLVSVGWVNVPSKFFALMAYHLFSIGFVSIGLTGGGGGKGAAKTIIKGSVWLAFVWTALLCIQSALGAGIIGATNHVVSDKVYEGIGFLMGHGFAQGPGQTLGIASVWESVFKVPNAITIGLTFAAVGYFVAALIGVPLANWGVRKGYAANAPKDLPPEFITGIHGPDDNASAGTSTTHSATIDSVAFHLAILLGTYALSFYVTGLLKDFLLPPTMAKLAYGFVFMWGLIVAMIVRLVLNVLGIGRLIDNDLQRRLTGTTVDFLVVATMMAIQIGIVWKYILPISAVVAGGVIVTLFVVLYFGRRATDYAFERSMALFGYVTGTGASGLLLLRIVDPEFKSPVAMEVGLMNIVALFTATHIVFMNGAVPGPQSMGVWGMVGVQLATAAILLILLKVFRLWGPKQF